MQVLSAETLLDKRTRTATAVKFLDVACNVVKTLGTQEETVPRTKPAFFQPYQPVKLRM